jgi:hypothetical protein
MEGRMSEDDKVDQPQAVSDQALDQVAGGGAAELLQEMSSNVGRVADLLETMAKNKNATVTEAARNHRG